MSLWEKWEKEKLEKQGIKVERKSDVEIHDTRPKPDFRTQMLIAGGTLLGCILFVYFAVVLYATYGGKWEDSYLARLLVETEARRQSVSHQ